MDVVQVIWLGFHCVLLATILLLAWLTRPGAQVSPTALSTLTAISAACDLVTTLLFALQVGFLNTAPHFVIFTVIVLTRILYPYRVSAAATLSVIVGLVGVTGAFIVQPELSLRIIPESTARMVTSRLEILSTGSILLALIVALFVGVNFIVNQRNILQRYLTEQVLNRYLPPKLVEQAEIGTLSFDHEPERKVLTVMFADLVGFTALSEKLGADGVGKLINRYLGELSEIAHYHGGTIDKFVGDCIMVFFWCA